MPLKEPLAVIDAGVLCPVGLDVAQATASMRAQIHRKQETGWLDLRHEEIVLGEVPDTVLHPLRPAVARVQPADSPLRARLLQLAAPALQEALEAAAAAGAQPPPLLLAGPPAAADAEPIVDPAFVEQLGAQAEVDLDLPACRVTSGRAGVFTALGWAAELLEGRHELVVVGGVDSYADEQRLAELQREGRLQTSGPQDAFTPGEGAAALLVTTRTIARHAGWQPLALITGLEQAQELGHWYSEQPHRGDGLAVAITRLLAEHDTPISHVVTSLNGERLFSREWGVAMVRNHASFTDPLQLEHPAEFTGDMGAALAPLMLAVTATQLADGRCAGPSLVWAASDHAERGALLLSAD